MEINKRLEAEAMGLVTLVYRQIPKETSEKWGIDRYNRVRTLFWKHIEQSATIEEFVNNFFRMMTANLSEISNYITTIEDKESLFIYLSSNLPLLIGRLQYQNREKRKEKEEND